MSMISDFIIQLFNHYGYFIFFLAFCLGPFGIPVPNEITLLTGGFLSNNENLNPWMLYGSIFIGYITAITIAYFLGRLFGEKFNGKFQSNRYFKKTEAIFNNYGNIAMCLGLLIPVVRYILPVFIGINRFSFKRFALISYSCAFIWTALMFSLGRYIGPSVYDFFKSMDPKLPMLAIILLSCFFIINKRAMDYLKRVLSRS